MRDLLLDTHALLWFATDSKRMPDRVKDMIESPDSRCLISYASLWEMAIKTSLGKLVTPFSDLHCSVESYLSDNGFELLHPGFGELIWLGALPFHHGDPFDRIIVASALEHQFTIVGCDAVMDAYGVTRFW